MLIKESCNTVLPWYIKRNIDIVSALERKSSSEFLEDFIKQILFDCKFEFSNVVVKFRGQNLEIEVYKDV